MLLVFSFILTSPFNVTAELKRDLDDGVWFDDFKNYTNMQDAITNNSVSTYYQTVLTNLSNGRIELEEGSKDIIYDYEKKADNIVAWEIGDTLMVPGSGTMAGAISYLTDPDTILEGGLGRSNTQQFSTTDYNNIIARDGDSAFTKSSIGGFLNITYHPMALFRFDIDEDKDFINKIEINWYSDDYNPEANIKDVQMWAWAYGDPIIKSWNPLANMDYTETNIDPAGRLFELIDADSFVSDEGKLDILVFGTPDVAKVASRLETDFIKLEVRLDSGYFPLGYVNSTLINPDSSKFTGWEYAFWDSSRPSDISSVKVQITDKFDNIIKTLEGNEKGFTYSPIDLSTIDINDYPQIKLKMTLISSKLGISPKLYSWGVTWQTEGKFSDKFAYTYRVDQSYGLDISTGEVKLSKFYSDWPIFGKNAENTRSYFGPEAKPGSNETYWHSNIDTRIGGGFLSPVVSNGKVYIGSMGNKIYAYNFTTNDIGEEQEIFDVSPANYPIETSAAVGNNKVVFGTSAIESLNNKIYALNAENLSDNKIGGWKYPKTGNFNDKTICFSAAPTISKNRVYLTSWTGQFWKQPTLNYLIDKLNSMLKGALGLNNRLIGLDLDSGEPCWESDVYLPAGSFSSPAVSDGLIYVGCRNFNGSSLFVFDENTGEEVWNASVGAIERASPVVVDTSQGKVVMVLSREQEIFSLTGNDKIHVLDADTGEEKWNKTIGENTSILLRNLGMQGLNFKHYMATWGPAATPAALGNTAYVLTPVGDVIAYNLITGEEKWKYDGLKTGLLPSLYTASPVVVDNIVYVASSLYSSKGNIHALNSNTGKFIRDYSVAHPDSKFPPPTYIYSSPVVTDGLILTSVDEWFIGDDEPSAHLYCLGSYTNNSFGRIYSIPIHVPKGNWWDKFNANYFNTTNNTITFSILDEHGNTLYSGLNGSDNNISDPNIYSSSIIQLCAELKINEEKQAEPILYDWDVSWKISKVAPKFVNDSFFPDTSGWINTSIPTFKIDVYDTNPGLDVGSARFKAVFDDNSESAWITADCTGENGTTKNQTITADFAKLNLDENSSNFTGIKIKILDLAGNSAIFNLSEEFKLDIQAPESLIILTYEDIYNKPVVIKASGEDPVDEYGNSSGIKNIGLYYRNIKDSKWNLYGSEESPFEWEFDLDESGEYEFSTRARDKAGNYEEFKDDAEVSFIYDNTNPEFNTKFGKNTTKINPKFSIDISDDYKLKKLEYMFGEETKWTEIASDINKTEETIKWVLPSDYWQEMNNDEEYYIFFRITDYAGNTKETRRDNTAIIIKDENATDSYVDISEFEKIQWDDEFKISAEIPDEVDVKKSTLYYKYSDKDEDWEDLEWKQFGEELSNAPFEWSFKAEEGNGFYQFKIETTDTSSFVYESEVETVSVTIFPAALSAILVILGIILLFATIFVIFKLKKKK
jgi:outer membrane protein assembly factor BamB